MERTSPQTVVLFGAIILRNQEFECAVCKFLRRGLRQSPAIFDDPGENALFVFQRFDDFEVGLCQFWSPITERQKAYPEIARQPLDLVARQLVAEGVPRGLNFYKPPIEPFHQSWRKRIETNRTYRPT